MARDAGRRYRMSFDIAPGEMVALAGGSGRAKVFAAAMSARSAAGKFTLGEITLDGNRLDRHTIRQLRGNTFSYAAGVQALNSC